MSVNEVTARNDYTGNGSTTAFTYGFRILTKTDIEVLVDGVVKTVDSDYSVSGLGASGGGTVTFTTAPANLTKIALLRKQKAEQVSDYVPNEATPAERIEKDLDKLQMQLQQMREVVQRALKFQKFSLLKDLDIPEGSSATNRAKKFLRWNAAGTAFEIVSQSSDVVGVLDDTIPSYTLAALPAAGTAGRLARVTDDVRGPFIDTGTVWRSLQGNVANVLDWGTAAAALQAAHDSLPSTGGTILIPSNTTIALGTTRVNFSKNIILMGFGWTSKITADTTTLSDPGGNDRGIINIRHTSDVSALDFVGIYNLSFDFGGTRASTDAEGRRGLNIYRANNVYLIGNRFKGGVGNPTVGIGAFGTTKPTGSWIEGNFFNDFSASVAVHPNGHDTHISNNRFLTGISGIEAGTINGLQVSNNYAEDMNGYFITHAAVNFEISGNTGRNMLITTPGSGLGVINTYAGGENTPAEDGTIFGNVFSHTGATTLRHGILLQRGTATSDNLRIAVHVNVMKGFLTGVETTSLIDGSITDNILVGAGVGAGITLKTTGQTLRNSVSGNNIRNFAARAQSLTTNGPIQDQTAEVDANIIGWNTQENALVLGVYGRIDFANLDTTPSVRRPSLLYGVSNSAATEITQLDNATIGQEVTLLFFDANTTLTDGGNFKLASTFVSSADDTITLVAQDASPPTIALWVEKSRSVN